MRACLTEFVEEDEPPKDAKKAVYVPERKGDAQANIADSENGESVGHRPQAAGEDGPRDEVGGLSRVGVDLGRAAHQRGNAPACEEYAYDHQERDDDGRHPAAHQFIRRLGSAYPSSRSKD